MKNRRLTISLLVVMLAVVALVAVGCKKTTGGGWINIWKAYGDADGIDVFDSNCEPLGKATFGFQMRCKDTEDSAHITGQLQWNDHANKVKFHAVGDMPLDGSCDEDWGCLDELSFWAQGTYFPQPKARFDEDDGGEFSLWVFDFSEPGTAGIPDMILIKLTDGVYDDYNVWAFLKGGNIQVHSK